MNCRYCGASNAEDEHRCGRCGRRVREGLPASPRSAAVPAPRTAPLRPTPPETSPPGPRFPLQQSLFGEREALAPKVISFDSIRSASWQPPSPRQFAAPAPGLPARPARPRRVTKRETDERQPRLDFLPPVPEPRRLKTTVEAAINCDAPVAPWLMRAGAVMLDALIVMIATASIPGFVYLKGGSIHPSRTSLLIGIASFALLFLFYKVLACLGPKETPGTDWMGLRILHFDGRPPDRRRRLLRLLAGCLSILPGGAGLLWALADEERLTWHDHMSKTFTTLR